MNLNQYLDLRPGVRSRCGLCDARRGLAVWDHSKYRSSIDDNGSGVFKCFACDAYGDGARYLEMTTGITRAEALRRMGLGGSMKLLDIDRERSRAAWKTLRVRQAEAEGCSRAQTMQACRDLVFLRNRMTGTESTDWRRHEMLPHRLRQSQQAQRQASRVASYLKEVQTETT